MNNAAVTALEIGTIRSKLVVRKLGFLRRQLLDTDTGTGVITMRSLVDELDTLCLVKNVSIWRIFMVPTTPKTSWLMLDGAACMR